MRALGKMAVFVAACLGLGWLGHLYPEYLPWLLITVAAAILNYEQNSEDERLAEVMRGIPGPEVAQLAAVRAGLFRVCHIVCLATLLLYLGLKH